MADAAIVVHDLAKAYGAVPVLRGVSFEVGAGEVVALLGPNGAGKTTTVEILEGFRPRDGGHVTVLGHDPASRSDSLRRRVGVVLQETVLDPFLTVGETVDWFRGWHPDSMATDEVLDLVGLRDLARRRTSRLSGGQQRRLDVALGLVGRPELVFLDEPTTGFDPGARREAWDTIHRLRDAGVTIVLTTHYLDEAAALADRLVVLAHGRIVADGPPERIGDRDRAYSVSFRPPQDSPVDMPGFRPTVGGMWQATVHDVTATVTALHRWSERHHQPLRDLSIGRRPLEDVYLELIA